MASGGDDGPWIFAVPSTVVERLRGSDLHDVVTRVMSEEWRLSRWTVADVEQLLVAVRRLALKVQDDLALFVSVGL